MTENYDELGAIMAYENGTLEDEGVIELFQHLVDNGHAWTLQRFYGRMAANLLIQGLIVQHEKCQTNGCNNTKSRTGNPWYCDDCIQQMD